MFQQLTSVLKHPSWVCQNLQFSWHGITWQLHSMAGEARCITSPISANTGFIFTKLWTGALLPCCCCCMQPWLLIFMYNFPTWKVNYRQPAALQLVLPSEANISHNLSNNSVKKVFSFRHFLFIQFLFTWYLSGSCVSQHGGLQILDYGDQLTPGPRLWTQHQQVPAAFSWSALPLQFCMGLWSSGALGQKSHSCHFWWIPCKLETLFLPSL